MLINREQVNAKQAHASRVLCHNALIQGSVKRLKRRDVALEHPVSLRGFVALLLQRRVTPLHESMAAHAPHADADD